MEDFYGADNDDSELDRIKHSQSSIARAVAVSAPLAAQQLVVTGGGYTRLGRPHSDALVPAIVNALDLKPQSRFAELSGDAGIAALIAEHARLINPALVVGVDADEEAGEGAAAAALRRRHHSRLLRRHTTLLDFTREFPPVHYDAAVVHQVLHTLTEAELRDAFVGIHKQLSEGGKLLLVTRTAAAGDAVPLFPAATEAWRAAAAACAPDALAAMLRDAGFTSVAKVAVTAPVRLPLPAYCNLLDDRFWPCLTTLSDEQLAEGVAAMRARHAEQAPTQNGGSGGGGRGGARDTVAFEDAMVFVIASK